MCIAQQTMIINQGNKRQYTSCTWSDTLGTVCYRTGNYKCRVSARKKSLLALIGLPILINLFWAASLAVDQSAGYCILSCELG